MKRQLPETDRVSGQFVDQGVSSELRILENGGGGGAEEGTAFDRLLRLVVPIVCWRPIGCCSRQQAPVSTMQRTGLTNYFSFLVLPGLERGMTYVQKSYHSGIVNSHFPVYYAIFDMVTSIRTTFVILEQDCS